MGNVVGKKEEEMVEGGFVFPTGTVYQKSDCDLRAVKKVIQEGRLSPFYKGLGDQSSLVDSLECPICFLYYPLNVNYARCCNQPLCTECFVQIHPPKTGGPAICPFCAQPDFGIVYFPPSGVFGSKQEKIIVYPIDSPMVVSVDSVHPNGRHFPPSAQMESPNLRRMTISGRPSGSRSSTRRNPTSSSFSGADGEGHRTLRVQSPSSRFAAGRDVESELENLMIMEAIQQSLREHERQRRREREQEQRERTRGGGGLSKKPESVFSAADDQALQFRFEDEAALSSSSSSSPSPSTSPSSSSSSSSTTSFSDVGPSSSHGEPSRRASLPLVESVAE